MKVIIKRLAMKNFKGFKDKVIKFDEGVTKIKGENESGKTTINDAFAYILFDKNSNYESTFDIKPQDEEGQDIHRLETEVEAELEVDGSAITLKKIYKEKWVKKRGAAKEELTGHTTDHFINGVPVKKRDYDAKIDELVKEDIFKLITDPFYFPVEMHWKERRDMLEGVAGAIETSEVAGRNENLKKLEAEIEKAGSVDKLAARIKHEIKEYKKEKKNIPPRIDELNNSIIEVEFTKEVIEKKVKALEGEIEKIENKLSDVGEIYKANEKINKEIYELKQKLREIEEGYNEEVSDKNWEIKKRLRELELEEDRESFQVKKFKDQAAEAQRSIEEYDEILEDLRNEIRNVHENVKLGEIKASCPTCGQALPSEEIEKKRAEIEARHKKECIEKKEKINEKGKYYAGLKEGAQEKKELKLKAAAEKEEALKQTNKLIGEAQEELLNLPEAKEFTPTDEYKEIQAKINELQEKIAAPDEKTLNELKSSRGEIRAEIKEYESRLNDIKNNKRTKARMNELLKREEELSEKIIELEGQEFAVEEFERERARYIEEKVNKKFDNSIVQFRLFENQVNGGLKEVCEALVRNQKGNLVTFRSANNAGRYNAGIAIINTLTEYFGVNAPIFIDNAEGINKLRNSKSQVVELHVADKGVKLEVF